MCTYNNNKIIIFYFSQNLFIIILNGAFNTIYLRLIQIFVTVGSTERAVLANCDKIVQESLPLVKIQQYYEEIPDSCRDVVLGYVSHYEDIKLVSYM